MRTSGAIRGGRAPLRHADLAPRRFDVDVELDLVADVGHEPLHPEIGAPEGGPKFAPARVMLDDSGGYVLADEAIDREAQRPLDAVQRECAVDRGQPVAIEDESLADETDVGIRSGVEKLILRRTPSRVRFPVSMELASTVTTTCPVFASASNWTVAVTFSKRPCTYEMSKWLTAK